MDLDRDWWRQFIFCKETSSTEFQIASERRQEIVPVDELPRSQLSDDEVVPVEDTYVVPVSRPVY